MRLLVMAISTAVAVVFANVSATAVLAQQPKPGAGGRTSEAAVQGTVTGVERTGTPLTVTVHPKRGSDVTLGVVAGTVINRTGRGAVTLGEVNVDDRVLAVYDPDTLEACRLSVSPPLDKYRSYNGTVKSVATDSFVMKPRTGPEATITLNAQTRYKVPGVRKAAPPSLKTTERVAVLAVEDGGAIIGLDVVLIPARPIAVHVDGTVTAYTEDKSIGVKDRKGRLWTVSIDSKTRVRLDRGVKAVNTGDLAVVLAKREPDKDGYVARHVTVFGPRKTRP